MLRSLVRHVKVICHVVALCCYVFESWPFLFEMLWNVSEFFCCFTSVRPLGLFSVCSAMHTNKFVSSLLHVVACVQGRFHRSLSWLYVLAVWAMLRDPIIGAVVLSYAFAVLISGNSTCLAIHLLVKHTKKYNVFSSGWFICNLWFFRKRHEEVSTS